MTPEVSVVMSVYNGQRHLAETLRSVLQQEGVSFEVIVIDDGSTDSSPAILAELAMRHPRVRIIRQENAGLTRALIRGCAEARAPYIARQDVGDLSLPGRLHAQKQALDADPDLAFVSGWTEFCGPELEPLYDTRGTGTASSPTMILSDESPNGVIDGPSCHPSVMFRGEAYHKAGGYRPEFYFGQDWDLWYRLAEVGKFQMIQRPVYVARVEPRSISGVNAARQREIGRLSREALRLRRSGRSDEPVLREAAAIRPSPARTTEAGGYYFIGECLRRRGDVRARRYLRDAIRRNPLFGRAWIRYFQTWSLD